MAGNSKDVFLRGKVKFFKLLGRGDVEYQAWGTVLYPNAESYAKILDMKKSTDTCDGILNEVKMDDEGYYLNLKRPWMRKFKGQEIAFQPPIVLDKDNIPWGNDKYVGNGSDATIKLEYYTFKPPFKQKRGSAIRLVSARIEDLVPYEPKKDFTEEEQKVVRGLTEDTKPVQYF